MSRRGGGNFLDWLMSLDVVVSVCGISLAASPKMLGRSALQRFTVMAMPVFLWRFMMTHLCAIINQGKQALQILPPYFVGPEKP